MEERLHKEEWRRRVERAKRMNAEHIADLVASYRWTADGKYVFDQSCFDAISAGRDYCTGVPDPDAWAQARKELMAERHL